MYVKWRSIFLILFLTFSCISHAISSEYSPPYCKTIIAEPDFTSEDIFIKIVLLKNKLGVHHAQAIAQWMYKSIKTYNLNPNTVIAIAHIESGFRQDARGTQHDTGIMQVMPFWTKRELCKNMKLWHAQDNIECGCRILRSYIDLFDQYELAGVIAYNQGEYNVRRYIKHKINLRYNKYAKLILRTKDLLDQFDKHRRSLNNDNRHLTRYYCTLFNHRTRNWHIIIPNKNLAISQEAKNRPCDGETDGECDIRW